jgi:N-acetylglucosaminyldiphosphoundecaprenol N-acetyl-beta-D-mannosaminyltransferase
LGCPVDAFSLGETVMMVEEAVRSRKRLQMVAVNVDQVMKCRRNPVLAQAMRTADLCFADGVPVIWAAGLLGQPLPGRVSGTDLVWELARLSAMTGASIAMVGGQVGVAERAAKKMRARFPGAMLHVISTPTPLDAPASYTVANEIRRLNAAIVLVALGAPRQELWVAEHLVACGALVGAGVGSAFDIISGRLPRAPKWMCDHGLEWLYRLAQDPRRLARRYLIEDSPFLGLVAWAAARRLTGGRI